MSYTPWRPRRTRENPVSYIQREAGGRLAANIIPGNQEWYMLICDPKAADHQIHVCAGPDRVVRAIHRSRA